jgi:hypothetical protein
MRVKVGKNADNLGMPCPPEILCQNAKPFMEMVDRFRHTYAPLMSVEEKTLLTKC